MVGNIYFIDMPYSNFRQSKARPVLVYKIIDKNDLLVLPLTTNLKRDGIKISTKDIKDGSIKKDSIVIAPKLTAIDKTLISAERFIASLKEDSFQNVKEKLCFKLGCL